MSKVLKQFLSQRVLGHKRNLVSINDHYAAMQRLMQDRTVHGVLDAGASDGRVTRKLLRVFPEATAYLFEPQPDYRSRLEAYAEKDNRIRPQYMALSDRQGEIELNVNRLAGMTSIFATNQQSAELYPEGEVGQQTLSVPVTTIDDWREAQGNPPIEVMKFDIQAAELTALKGAVKTLETSTQLIYSEVFFNPLYEGGALFGDIDAYLRDYGFKLYSLYKPKSTDDDMLMWANAIFIKSGT